MKIWHPFDFSLLFHCETRKWMNDSYHYWDGLRQKEDASLSGVMSLSVYCFSSTDPAIVRVAS